MKLTFLGATGTVTGSKYLLETNGKKILIDCGLFQGLKDLRLLNWSALPVKPSEIDAILLTHAHIDHSGFLPVLTTQGFTGKIYATPATIDLCRILLPDSGYLQEEDAKRANKYGYTKHHPAKPLYTERDAKETLSSFEPMEFFKPFSLFDDVTVTAYHASHILGASFIEIRAEGKKIVFSGDVGRPHDPILKPPSKLVDCDYLILESTYGNRTHDPEPPENIIEYVIQNTLKHQGSILIPAFAVGRSQHILYYLHQLKKQGRIPDIPVFLDSPMAIDATNLLQKYQDEHKLGGALCSEVCKIAKYIHTAEESKGLANHHASKIIISASGMLTGGRVLHHLKNLAPHPQNTILLAGFQAAGTRGARLAAHEDHVKVHGEMVPIRAKVEMITNASAHADYKEMLIWLHSLTKKPKKLFLTHGEPNSSLAMKQHIEEEYGWHCYIPKYLEQAIL